MEDRGNNGTGGQSLNSEINVTPLVDVMLVVLIIFIVVTPLLQHGVGVNLPEARNVTTAVEDDHQALTVVLKNDGRIFLGADPIDRIHLTSRLRSRRVHGPHLRFQIKADRDVPYGEIKGILQAGREAGFRGASMIAREREE